MKPAAIAVTLVAVAVAAALGGYRFAAHRTAAAHAPAAAVPAKDERRVLYWHDPMYPQHKFDKPGKSPFMDMQLVPVYADQAGGEAPGVAVSATAAQNLGVRTAVAQTGSLAPRFRAVGTVGWNERLVVVVQTRAAGFVEKLHARAPLDPVAKGAPLVEILVPDWASAQEEFLLLVRSDERDLAAAARQRLVLLGMSEAQIDAVAKRGEAQARFTIAAPISGVIAELGVREGMTVAAGQLLYRLVDLASVWVTAEVPESDAQWLQPGAPAEARVPAFPQAVFKGRVGAILPEVNAATRTVRARVEVSNPGARLKPGMFANLLIAAGAGKEAVLVPSEAVIRTGERSVVVVQDGKRFVPVQVQVGQELDGRSEILAGISAGVRVVASGQFLIDSEASLKGALARLEGAVAATAKDGLHPGSARVLQVDAKKGRVELDHGPMPSIQWPAMQMGFRVADPALLAGLQKGDRVEFHMRGEPDKDGDYVIEKLAKKAAP